MWSSKTGTFPSAADIAELENSSAQEVLGILMRDDPLVALRGMVEIMLNDGWSSAKLHFLLQQPTLTAHWQKFVSDSDVNEKDKAWARQLGWSG